MNLRHEADAVHILVHCQQSVTLKMYMKPPLQYLLRFSAIPPDLSQYNMIQRATIQCSASVWVCVDIPFLQCDMMIETCGFGDIM